MICPECDGKKQVAGLFLVDAEGFERERRPVIFINCSLCDGTGEVDSGYAQRVQMGAMYRKMRLNAEIGIRDFSLMSGIDVVLVSAFERGKRIEPHEIEMLVSEYEHLCKEDEHNGG